jgi:hypothetical protein
MKVKFQFSALLLFSLLSITACNDGSVKIDPSAPEFRKWAPVPPLGWNSWDCYGPTVMEQEVKANADYMAKNLKKYGWKYIVVDIRWYVENDKSGGYNEADPRFTIDEYGRFTPAVNRFPSAAGGKGFKPLSDYVHSKGLKFGIHVMRGVPVVAVKNSAKILDSNSTADGIYSPEGQCLWLKDMYTIVAGRPGAQEYYNSIFKLYASWGVDFVKVDDLSGRTSEIEMIRKAIDNCGRPIVISISPGGDKPETAEFLKNNVNMWRTSNDFWDNWQQLKNQFAILQRWEGLSAPGAYPDGDMLPLGKIGLRAERGEPRWTAFTKDEQYTLMTLFSIFRSPLMFGGDLPSNDDFTLSLITNKDVIYVNQRSTNNRQLFRKDDHVAWVADDPKTGDKFLALFNASDRKLVDETKALWKSRQLTNEDTEQNVEADLDVTGATKLYLVTTYDDVVGFSNHNLTWTDPVVTGPKSTVKLTGLEWVKTSGRRPYAESNMINTSGTTVIEYDLPAGATRFKVKAGLRAEAISGPQSQNPNVHRPNNGRFLVFTEDPAGAEPADSAEISVSFDQLGLAGTHTVKDLWTGEKLGNYTDSFSAKIRRHGAGLFRIH